MMRTYLVILAFPAIALATNATWDLNAAGDWNVDGNWTPAIFPNSIDSTANFLNIITAGRTITLGQDITIGTVIFDDNNNYIIDGVNTLTFEVTSGNAAITILNTNGTGAHRINANLAINRNLEITSNSTARFRIDGNISGAGGITWNATDVADLFMNGVNTYTGQTNINNGIFSYENDGCIPAGSVTTIGTGVSTNNPTLNIANNMTNPIMVIINSDGTFNQNNNRTVRLLSLAGSGQVNISTGNTGVNLFEINGTASSEFSGTISGGLSNSSSNPNSNNRVYKDGPSIQVFSGNNDYISRTFIANGAILAQNNNALGVPGNDSAVYIRSSGTSGSLYLSNDISLTKTVFVNGPGYSSSGAIQNVSGNNTIGGPVQIGWSGGPETPSDVTIQTAAGSLDLTADISGTNNLTKTGNGTLIFSGGVANTLTGITTINGGVLQLNKTAPAQALAADAQINSGGTLQMLNENQIVNTAVITNNGGTFDLNGNATTIGTFLFNSGTATQSDALLTLTSAATALSMRNTSLTGDLLLTVGGAVLFDNAAGGTAIISGNIDLGGLTIPFNISSGTAIIDMEISGAISNGALTKQGQGTLLLLGPNTYAGGTSITAGTLQGNTTGLQGAIVDNANLIFDQQIDGTFSGSISGIGTFLKQGPGALTIATANSVAGIATVSQGDIIESCG